MLETIVVFLIGFIPGFFSIALMRKVQSRINAQYYQPSSLTAHYPYRLHSYSQSPDYRHVEGLGYMVGDLTCQFNARSPYIRCAINPSGPCQGCPHYESIDL